MISLYPSLYKSSDRSIYNKEDPLLLESPQPNTRILSSFFIYFKIWSLNDEYWLYHSKPLLSLVCLVFKNKVSYFVYRSFQYSTDPYWLIVSDLSLRFCVFNLLLVIMESDQPSYDYHTVIIILFFQIISHCWSELKIHFVKNWV